MGGSEDKLLDSARQPVVTPSVKDLPATGKADRFLPAALSSAAPSTTLPDEAGVVAGVI